VIVLWFSGDVTGTWGVRGDLVTIHGDEYMKVRHVNMLPEVGDMQLYASNLFTGNDELSEYTHLLFKWTSRREVRQFGI
jgi:hypothetical protein